MIDYHAHLLPGLDDGPSTLDESIQMSRLLVASGFNTVYCTPHLIKHRYDASNATVRQSVRELQTTLDRCGIALKLLAGREYRMDNHFHEYLGNLMPLEGSNYLLIEIPPDSYQGMVLDAIAAITRKGLTPMIAHPERCQMLAEYNSRIIPRALGFFRRNSIRDRIALEYSYQQIDLLDWLVSVGCCFQCNIGSIEGVYGNAIQTGATHLWKQGIYTHFGTDAHSAEFLARFNSPTKTNISITASYMQNIPNGVRNTTAPI
jgi:protein-tyrosine phosphatase